MKKFYALFIAILITTYASAQNSEDSKIKLIGDFVSVTQQCRTATNNELDDLSVADKVILKKSLITSIVVQFDSRTKEKGFEIIKNKVIVTPSEKVVRYEGGMDSKAIGYAFKPYEFLFDDSSSAESFALELLEKCAVE